MLSKISNLISGKILPNKYLATRLFATQDEEIFIDSDSVSHEIHMLTAFSQSQSKPNISREIPDPKLIFDTTITKLEGRIGKHNLLLPPEVVWMIASPGCMKGYMAKEIAHTKGLQLVSQRSMLAHDERIRDKVLSGKLWTQRDLLEAVITTLMKFQSGLLVFGIPRNNIQANILTMIHSYARSNYVLYKGSSYSINHKQPRWKFIIVHNDEEASVSQQIERGQKVKAHNDIVKETGVGNLLPQLSSDFNSDLAKLRYQNYTQNVYNIAKTLSSDFPLHIVNGSCTEDELIKRIKNELKYQSSLELIDSTYSTINEFPIAQELVNNARIKLIERLEMYENEHKETFDWVVMLIKNEFSKILETQSMSGTCYIRSDNPILMKQYSVDMLRDILSERGFRVTPIMKHYLKPVGITQTKTGRNEIEEDIVPYYLFEIESQRVQFR